MLEGSDKDPHLVKGPYISLSRSFAEGEYIEVLIRKGILHPAIQGIAEYPKMFAHQQEVLEAVKEGKHVLVSTGTGSGKTEAFLYPITDHSLELRDNNAPSGIVAIIVTTQKKRNYQFEKLRDSTSRSKSKTTDSRFKLSRLSTHLVPLFDQS